MSKKPRAPSLEKGAAAPATVAYGELAAALAHEVRNPLNAMAIHLELIETRAARVGGDDGEGLRRSAEVLHREVERIDQLLVEYLRHVGPREGARRPIEVAALLAAAAARATVAGAARKVAIETRIERGAPRWPLDGGAIGQLLDALLANAVEASPPGATITVRALTDEENSAGIIEVIDRGEGIAAAILPRIFALGFTTRRRHTGLGLAVAKQIAKGQGGALSAFSDGPGHGATLRVELPLD